MPYRRSRLQDYYDQLLGRKPAEPKPKEPTPTNSPFLDFGNPPAPAPVAPPKPPTPTLPPTPLSPSAPTQENPPTQRSTGQESKSDAGKRSDSSRNKSENESTRTNPPASDQFMSGLPPDIEWNRQANEYDPRIFLDYVTQPSEENAQAQRNIYAVMTGARLDDEEHDVAQELKRILQTMAPQGLYEDEPWHSTRLGPAPAAVAPVQDRTSNITFPDGSRIFQPADPVAQERSYRIPPPELNHPSQEYLTNTFPNSWNPEWKTRDEFEAFLQGRLETFLPGLDLSIVPWDKLNVHGLVFYYGSLIDKAIKDNEQTADFNTNVWLAELDKERELASDLLSRTEKAPLEDESSLLEAFGYKDAAQARNRLTTEVSFVFQAYGLQLPTDLNQWSLLELANAYHGLLTKVVQPSFHAVEGSEDHKKALAFIDGFEHQIPRSSGYVASRSEQYVIDRLEGRQEGDWGPAANLFLFVASIFIEPVDWIVTGVEMIDAASRGDWGQVVVNGVLAALPFVSGQVDNVARKALGASEDFAQAGLRNVPPNQVSNISELNLTRGFQRAGSDYVMAADNYVSRTVSGYNSRNAGLLNTQMKRAARVDDNFAWRLKTHSKQEMHHIVPVGRIEGDDARDIMSEKGVFVNSAYNGIALDTPIHRLTNSKNYTDSVSKVIVGLKNAPPEEIAQFLEETAERLQKLNGYPKGDLLEVKFQSEIMDWLGNYLQT